MELKKAIARTFRDVPLQKPPKGGQTADINKIRINAGSIDMYELNGIFNICGIPAFSNRKNSADTGMNQLFLTFSPSSFCFIDLNLSITNRSILNLTFLLQRLRQRLLPHRR